MTKSYNSASNRIETIYPTQNKVNLEPEDANWWENRENFPCMLICTLSSGDALVWVHYQIDGIAYDVRDNSHRLIDHTNWRRATKEEILNNIKGL